MSIFVTLLPKSSPGYQPVAGGDCGAELPPAAGSPARDVDSDAYRQDFLDLNAPGTIASAHQTNLQDAVALMTGVHHARFPKVSQVSADLWDEQYGAIIIHGTNSNATQPHADKSGCSPTSFWNSRCHVDHAAAQPGIRNFVRARADSHHAAHFTIPQDVNTAANSLRLCPHLFRFSGLNHAVDQMSNGELAMPDFRSIWRSGVQRAGVSVTGFQR